MKSAEEDGPRNEARVGRRQVAKVDAATEDREREAKQRNRGSYLRLDFFFYSNSLYLPSAAAMASSSEAENGTPSEGMSNRTIPRRDRAIPKEA